MDDFDATRQKRDRKLRRRILDILFYSRSSPTGGISGLRIMRTIEPGGSGGQIFEDDDHFISLCRDLVNKGLAEEIAQTRRKLQMFGPEFVLYKITAKGTSLRLETIPADPDIDDDRITEGNG